MNDNKMVMLPVALFVGLPVLMRARHRKRNLGILHTSLLLYERLSLGLASA